MSGECSRGEQCSFAHGPQELRSGGPPPGPPMGGFPPVCPFLHLNMSILRVHVAQVVDGWGRLVPAVFEARVCCYFWLAKRVPCHLMQCQELRHKMAMRLRNALCMNAGNGEAGGSDDDGYAGNDGAPRHDNAARHDGWTHGAAGHDAGSDAARAAATSGGASPGRAPQRAPSSQQQQHSHTVPRQPLW